ncbi:hypothetical protein ACTXT7_003544 [Hymenolepis weldensis]
MQCQATFLEKTIFKKCYVTARNINLMGLDWIDELNLIQFPDENETCQTLSNLRMRRISVRCCSTRNDNKQIRLDLYPQSTRDVPETLVTEPCTQSESTVCLILLRSIDYLAKEISRRFRTIRPGSRI